MSSIAIGELLEHEREKWALLCLLKPTAEATWYEERARVEIPPHEAIGKVANSLKTDTARADDRRPCYFGRISEEGRTALASLLAIFEILGDYPRILRHARIFSVPRTDDTLRLIGVFASL